MLLFKKSKLIISSSFIFLLACGYQPLINVKQTSYSIFNNGQFEIFSPENDIDFQSSISTRHMKTHNFSDSNHYFCKPDITH